VPSPTRRQVLALLSAGGIAAGLLAGGVLGSWWNQPADAPFARLEEEEAAVLRIIAGAAFPGGATVALDGAEAGLDRFFDELLGGLPEIQGQLLRLLLHALDSAAIADAGARLRDLEPAQARTFVTSLLSSDIAELRGAVTGLVILLGMGYTVHPQVSPYLSQFHRCGYGD
jgi:hypothetical protein